METKLTLREHSRKATAQNFRTDTALLQGGAPRGQSAYEQAVEGGYEGTKAEFEEVLASGVATVSDNINSVNTVAEAIDDVETVANNISTITDNADNIGTVATNILDVNTTASNISSVNTAASNIDAIIAAPTQAANAAESASNAQKWAEGLDSDVTPLGGEHSAKGWTTICQQLVESIGSVLHYKGSVATYADLPTSGQQLGDMWNISADGSNYVWTGSGWDAISGIVDLSAYRTASAQDAIDATLVPKTSIGAASGIASLDANTKVPVSQLPAMAGATGSVAGTSGLVPAPAATDNNKFLKGDGTWNSVDALPSQTGQSGKYLTTDGSNASWAAIPATLSADGTTIQNTSNVLSTVAVKDQRTSDAIKVWTGTKAQYDAIVTKDANTLYNVTDETPATAVAYITETYHNGASWYRVWSDGWCEQGGRIEDSGSANNNYEIMLLKPYNNTDYFAIHQLKRDGNDGSTGSGWNYLKTLSTDRFSVVAWANATIVWKAEGYIA